MENPKLATVNKIQEIKDQISLLYEDLNMIISREIESHGTGDWYYDDKGVYKKLSLVDNLKALKEGSVFRTTSIKRFEGSVKELKRKPKELE